MEGKSQAGKERQPIAGQPQSTHFEQIDSHRDDQHRPAKNSSGRDDLNLEGAKRRHDPIPDNPDTVDPGLTPQPPDPGVVPAGGYPNKPPGRTRPANSAQQPRPGGG